MLGVSTLPSPSSKTDQLRGVDVGDYAVGFPTGDVCDDDCFMVGDDDNLLDYINFSSCDVPSFFDADGDILPDLEVDPTEELLAEFSSSPEDPAVSPAADGDFRALGDPDVKEGQKQELLLVEEKDEKRLLDDVKNNGDEVVSSAVTTEQDSSAAGSDSSKSSASAEGHSKKKPSASAGGNKNSHGKRKVKVDWTPELHRRFVQAVEQLGIDKAVPSRILEIMGIQCLTRHNIASHLQKYRSHRKHLMAREAEAASWAQKRQMYATAAAVAGAPRKDMPSPWAVGFPPPGFVRPLHVWGHPPPPTAVEAAAPRLLPGVLPAVWPRHLPPPRPLPPWAHPPSVDPAYWRQQYNAARKWGPQAVTQGTPCVPPPMPPAAMLQRPGMVPPHLMYRPVIPPLPPAPLPPHSTGLAGLQLQLEAQPSKESIDAAIGDVLVKPWLPLPLGLKPPSLDSVMSELHKQGIPKVPPSSGS